MSSCSDTLYFATPDRLRYWAPRSATRTMSIIMPNIYTPVDGFDSYINITSRELQCTTVFGKHCECNAQKCTHLKRLPPLASHLLLLNHCVLTQHEGQKKMSKAHDRLRDSNRQHWSLLTMRLSIVLCVKSNPMGRFLDCQMPTF